MLGSLYAFLFHRGEARGNSRPPRPKVHPVLEVLEDRTVPSTLADQQAALLTAPANAAAPASQPTWQQELATLLNAERQLATLGSQPSGHGNGQLAREIATLTRVENQLVNLVSQQIGQSGSGSGSVSGSGSGSDSGSDSGSGTGSMSGSGSGSTSGSGSGSSSGSGSGLIAQEVAAVFG